MGVNKIVYGGQTKLDISNDTVTPSALLEGYTAHDNTGALIVGTASVGGEGGNVWQDANGYLHLDDESGIDLQTKSVTPTETAQSVTPDAGYYALEKVNVGAISSSYVGSGITRRSSSDLTASGATVSVPSGYYASNASKAVSSGSATTPATTVTANPSISVNSSGLITATASATKSVTPTVSAGYVSSGTAGTITVSGSNTSQLSTQAGKTVTPTESEQTAVSSGKYTTGAVKVGAISSTYVGSGITQRDSDDLTVSGATVTAPSGYYSASASKSVASGSAGTPTATKGTVSNHSVTVTPSVTNTTGYITGSTKTGTAVTVSASELVSGTKTITENGTSIDVTNYASVDVDVPSSSPMLVTRSITSNGTYSASSIWAASKTTEAGTTTGDGIRYIFSEYSSVDDLPLIAGNTYHVTGTIERPGKERTYTIDSDVLYSGSGTKLTFNEVGMSRVTTATIVNYNPVGAQSNVAVILAFTSDDDTLVNPFTINFTADGFSTVTVNVSGGGGSSYTLIASTEYTVSTSSTTAITLADFDTGDTSIWTSDKMVYVKIRDKAGRRNGYYYGSDSFIINLIKGNGLTATSSYQITGSSFYQNANGYLQQVTLYRSSSSAVTGYGIYPTYVRNDGGIPLNARYSTGSYPTGTIDGTFIVEVYLLDFPNGISLFDE